MVRLAPIWLVLLALPGPAGSQAWADSSALRARQTIVKLNSIRGRVRLWRCEAKRAYRPLAARFEYQTRSMCGPTSLANVLNALKRDSGSHARHSQRSVLRDSGRTLDQVRGLTGTARGFSLRQLHKVLAQYRPGATITVVTAREAGGLPRSAGRARKTETARDPAARVKAELISALGQKGTYVVANYDRSAIGQSGRGHFSPLGAYDARSDSFLVMDVSRKRGWAWVGADALVRAMGKTNTSRGYLVVSQ